MRRSRLLGPVAALTLGVTAAACGGNPSATVAHLGSTTTTTAATSGAAVSKFSMADAEKYSQCMRSHGVPDFPDPTSGPNGGVGFKIDGSKVGANQAQVQAAMKACKSLAPNGGVGPHLTAAQQQAFLNWAACIRSHGYPNFPDPDFSGGGIRVRIPAGGGGTGPGASQLLQNAQKACASKLPSGFGGGPLAG